MAYQVRWYDTQVLAEIEKIKRSALKRIGMAIAKDARALCPVGVEIRFGSKVWKEREPGTLKASIRYRITKGGKGVQIIAGSRKALLTRGGKKYMGRDPFYARFVEFGTSKMIARPFLRPAMARNQYKVLAEFTNKLK